MKVKILCVGKIKESYFRDAILEYKKRLGRYCTLEIQEVTDEKTPDEASEQTCIQIVSTEGRRLLKYIKDEDYVIALAINGKMMDSVKLADTMEDLAVHGHSQVSFVIGGSLGLSDEIIQRADFKLSFSPMTFPHQLMRVILLEQIYRSFRIRNHEPYHK